MLENQHQKVVNISYAILAGLVYFVFFAGMTKISGMYDLESRVKSIDLIIRGLAILVGVSVFFGLYLNQTVNAFMNEVTVELLTKVSWPTAKDTYSATVVVIVAVVIAGVVLSVLDWVFGVTLKWFWATASNWLN